MPDPFATFPTEVSLHVLAFLNPLSLARISSVSILWYELANLPDVWRSACLSLYPIALTAGVVVADDELETLSKEYRCERRSTENYLSQLYGNAILPPWSEMDLSKIRSLRLGLRENFVACCRDPKSFFTDALLIIKTIVPPLPPPPVGCPSNFVNLLRYGLAASTSGHQRNIRNTLEEGSWAFTIWSSSGSESKPEWLCYKMPEDLCIVRGVEVLPGAVSEVSARGGRDGRVHAAVRGRACVASGDREVGRSEGREVKRQGLGFVIIALAGIGNGQQILSRIRFSFGFNDNPAQMHYHSRWFDVKFESVAQYFDLSPDLIVGGYLFITTEGIHK
ncbi:hypothetical protein BC937DRAFT_87385 [Endogone sp. FLAS-F59071]|nr:hypothetical protein BC937DRAFT_87385 [Endogone sp. FLAS-F59071]|eukprot:RUS19492.1 hypothetical protein BC937DRAFT_87385 [Endogone sp. FLAS-F59071]